MADYTPLLTRAVIGQDEAARAGIYARARDALERQLRGFEPKLDEEQILAELAGLGTAIETVEAGARAEAMPVTAQAASEPLPPETAEPETPEEAPPALAEEAAPAPAPSPAEPVDEPEAPAALSVETSVDEAQPVPGALEDAPDDAQHAPDPDPLLTTEGEDKRSGPDETGILTAANTDEVSAPPLLEPVLPTARPRMPLRDEAKKSRKPLVMIAGAALVVMVAMGGLALTRRTAPDPLRSQKGQTQDIASADAGKTEGRLASEAPTKPADSPAPPVTPPASTSAPATTDTGSEAPLSTSTRAFMVLESPGNAPSQFEGRALWSFEPDTATKGEKTLRTIIAFPGSDITIDLSLSRNKDVALAASHLLMAIFDVPKGFEPVREMSPIEWRERESTAGSVFRGSVVPVQDNAFMITLDKAAEEANIALLRSQKWMVFEFRLANGRRGATLIEKGASGEKAAEEALKAWK